MSTDGFFGDAVETREFDIMGASSIPSPFLCDSADLYPEWEGPPWAQIVRRQIFDYIGGSLLCAPEYDCNATKAKHLPQSVDCRDDFGMPRDLRCSFLPAKYLG